MRILLLLFFATLTTFCFSQQYAYRFNGTTDQEILAKMENDLLSHPEFDQIKFKQKAESGELLFTLKPNTSKTEAATESPAMIVKRVLVSNGLEPLDFTELPKP